MELTPAQRRTLEQLIGLGSLPAPHPDLAGRVREDLERRLEDALPEGIDVWIGKHRLNDRERCEGLFGAALAGEIPPFRHSSHTALGALFHRALEVDVTTERAFDPMTVCERAASRLVDPEVDRSFGLFWAGLEALDRAEILAEAGRRLALFRTSFPPLPRRWAPQTEWRLKVVLARGRVVLSGAPDLVLGRRQRLAIDFKTGRAWPEHPEDMRFYSLIILLRTGVPAYRVATFFLDSGEWQAEEVTELALERAAERVVSTARAAVELAAGRPPALSPGPHCRWCPRVDGCPAASLAFGPTKGSPGARIGKLCPPGGLLPSGRLSYRAAIPSAPTGTAAQDPSREGDPRATVGRRKDGEGPVRDRSDPVFGRGPPQDVRAGHPP